VLLRATDRATVTPLGWLDIAVGPLTDFVVTRSP
jgi:hypothetical protein